MSLILDNDAYFPILLLEDKEMVDEQRWLNLVLMDSNILEYFVWFEVYLKLFLIEFNHHKLILLQQYKFIVIIIPLNVQNTCIDCLYELHWIKIIERKMINELQTEKSSVEYIFNILLSLYFLYLLKFQWDHLNLITL